MISLFRGRGWLRAGFFAGLLAATAAGCDEAASVPDGTMPAVFVEGADQVMVGVDNHITREGIRRARLNADTAYTFEAEGRLDLRVVTLTFFTEQGDSLGVLTGESAEYLLEAGDVKIRGDVKVNLSNGERFEAPMIEYISAAGELRADSGYVQTAPDGTVDRGSYVVVDLETDERRYGPGRTTTPEVMVPQ